MTIGIAAVSGVLMAGTAMAAPPPPPTPSPFPSIPPAIGPLPQPTLPDSSFAPIDQPGPELSVQQDTLDHALHCSPNASGAGREVVLFVPGTTFTPEEYSWNWFPAMEKLGRPYCSVELPDHAMGDSQVAAEYVVNAIRTVHKRSGRKVDIIGHSQGGTEPRFALRFWPDLRDMVDHYIGIAADNHGAFGANAFCAPSCAAGMHQQKLNSAYIQAINSHQETFPGIAYTQIYSRTDEFVNPNFDDTGTTSLHGGGGKITNVAIQDICPTGLQGEHLAVGTYDPTAYAIAMDALDHPGEPADPARVNRSACAQLFMPGVNPLTFALNYGNLVSTIATQLATRPLVLTEPPLKPYTQARQQG